jgi:hypothetical protein
MSRPAILVVFLLCVLAGTAGLARAGYEATAEVLFETLARVESRFRGQREEAGRATALLKQAELAEVEARARAKAARLSGDLRGFEVALAGATNALADQILTQLGRVTAALEVFEANRRDLARILPRLSPTAGQGPTTGQDQAQGQRFLGLMRDVSADMLGLANFFQGLLGDQEDPRAQMKLAGLAQGLLVIQQAIERGRQTAEAGPGGFAHAALAVANALETINGTIPLLALRRDSLLDQKERLRVSNSLVLIRLASQSVFGPASLNPLAIKNAAQDELSRDLERDRRLDEQFTLEGVGPAVPSRREIREALRSVRY